MMKGKSQSDYSELIPELRLQSDGDGVNIDTWLSGVGNYRHAIAYAHLFWPTFTVHDDCVLLADFEVTNYEASMAQTDGDKRAVEAVMNHRHLWDLFPEDEENATTEQVIHLGQRLQDMCSCKLHRDYPQRIIHVRFPAFDSDDLMNPQITFFQDHHIVGVSKP